MPIPQVNDRIKEAPVVVLRAVFAGIGQILLTADKVRARAAEQVWTADRPTVPGLRSTAPGLRSTAPGPRNGTTHAEPAVAEPSAVREAPVSPAPATKTPPATKSVRATKPAPATKTPPATKSVRATKPAPATKTPPATKSVRATKPAAATKPASATKATKATKTVPAPRAPKADPVAVEPPLPGWDDLSLASLRARLRGFDAATIRAMLAYEQAHARREPVITMLERRLAKITAG
jgi:outer membrane biosynthesis protein TonB